MVAPGIRGHGGQADDSNRDAPRPHAPPRRRAGLTASAYLIALRFLIAAITIVFAFASPASLALASQALVAAACAYVVVALVAVGLGRRAGRVGAVATVGMLLLDGVFLTIADLRHRRLDEPAPVPALPAAARGLAAGLPARGPRHRGLGHAAVRRGARGPGGGLIAPVDARPGEALDLRVLPVMNAVAFWVFAVALAAFSAINERELRQRRADLEAVVRIGIQIEDEGDPVRQAAIVLDGLIGPYALARGLVIGADDDGLVVLGARGISVEPRTEIPPRPDHAAGLGRGPSDHAVAARPRDAIRGSSWLMKGARRVIVAPMLADGRPVGAIVLERRYGQRPGLEQRTARGRRRRSPR